MHNLQILKHLKRLKQLKGRTKPSVDARMLKALTSPVRSVILFSLFDLLFFLFKIYAYFTDQTLQLKVQQSVVNFCWCKNV